MEKMVAEFVNDRGIENPGITKSSCVYREQRPAESEVSGDTSYVTERIMQTMTYGMQKSS
ncbi:MAG: hypothetical protein Q8P57_02190 [Candidatus Pacearchaeota archaeon]|nr:hypothetical protein [Candidatus Pacearchaeota archaeon]